MSGIQDLQTLKDAVRLRQALTQTDAYLFGVNEQDKTSSPNSDRNLPVVSTNGRAFARNFLKDSGQALTLASNTQAGTLVEFRSQQNVSQYGLVTDKTKNRHLAAALYVDPISAQAASRLLKENPEVVHLTLNEENIRQSAEYQQFLEPRGPLEFFLDPFDRLLFKIQVSLLGRLIEPFAPEHILITELIMGVVFALVVVMGMWVISGR